MQTYLTGKTDWLMLIRIGVRYFYLSVKKYFWTPEYDIQLKRCYQTARSREELIKNISWLQRVINFPRFAIIYRAAVLGVARMNRKCWTQDEIDKLHELAGNVGRRAIARQFGRTEYSVKAELRRFNLSLQFKDGYTQQDLLQVLGVSARTVRLWVAMQWLKPMDGRFTEKAIRRFLRSHPDQYHLARVDEAWFKGMIFDRYNNSEWLRNTSLPESERMRNIEPGIHESDYGCASPRAI